MLAAIARIQCSLKLLQAFSLDEKACKSFRLHCIRAIAASMGNPL